MSQKIKIKNNEIKELICGEIYEFPKYSTGILNLANRISGGTRPRIVGQMTDLIQEFEGKSIKEWAKWYKEKYPNAINNATEKIYEMTQNFKKTINEIDKNLIKE